MPVYVYPVRKLVHLREAYLALLNAVTPSLRALTLRFGSTQSSVAIPQCIWTDAGWRAVDAALSRIHALKTLNIVFEIYVAGGHFNDEAGQANEGHVNWIRAHLPNLPCKQREPCFALVLI